MAFSQTMVVNQEIEEVKSSDIVLKTMGGDSLDRAVHALRNWNENFGIVALTYQSGVGNPFLLELDSQLNPKVRHDYPDSSFSFWFGGAVTNQTYTMSGFKQAPGTDMDCYLGMIDENGKMLWDYSFGGSSNEQCYKLTKTSDNGYAVAGQTTSWGNGNIDGLVLKLSEHGVYEWHVTLGDSLLNRLYSIIEVGNGDLIISGITNANYPGNSDILIYRLDKHGNTIWEKKIEGPKGDIAHSMVKLTDSTFLIAGYTAEFSDSLSDLHLLHLNGDGELIKKLVVVTGNDVRLINGFVDEKGNYVGTGFVRENLKSDWDVLLFKVDAKFRKPVVKRANISALDEEAYHCIPHWKGYALVVGHTMGVGNGDVVVLKWRY
jgi:hypothetical protein